MLFNSIEFTIFLPIVFFLYWYVANRNLKLQNSLIILASYVFYGWWDWRFLTLIIFSSCVDYFVGIGLSKTEVHIRRKLLLLTSVFVNLGLLGFFKYYNFFIDSFEDAFRLFGKPIEASRLNIILPVGISFYTFQTMSYTIDVYKGKLKATKDALSFFAFVSFFPQLVAGPIERASNLLPQFYKKRTFNSEKAIYGFLLICWGLFMKIVIADNLAFYVNTVFDDVQFFEGFPLIWALLFFTFQIYCDFAGYSYIAIGTAKIFSFDLMTNFKQPYLATSFTDFWNRWHISLSSWFRDYVYIPLGGNRKGKLKTNRNIFITFLLSGLWHGANWTFVLWGATHGVLNVISRKIGKTNNLKVLKIGVVFIVTMFTWAIFRANSIEDLLYIGSNVFKLDMSSLIGLSTMPKIDFVKLFVFISILFIVDIFVARFERKEIKLSKKYYVIITSILMLLVYIFGSFEHQEFIYFQF